MMTQDRVQTIMRTWRVMRKLARERIERDGAFWATPIYPSVAAYPGEDVANGVIQQIKFEKATRAGIEIVECEGVMVEAWS